MHPSVHAPVLPRDRKLELLGLLLVGFAVMLAMSILSYHPSDDRLADAAFGLDAGPARNAVGMAGAGLAYWLVPNLGYAALIPVLFVFLCGYQLLRKRAPGRAPLLAATTVVDMLAASTILGWFGLVVHVNLSFYGGAAGTAMAGWLIRAIGAPGSIVFLAFVQLACLLVALPTIREGYLPAARRKLRALRSTFRRWRTRLARRLDGGMRLHPPIEPAPAVSHPIEIGYVHHAVVPRATTRTAADPFAPEPREKPAPAQTEAHEPIEEAEPARRLALSLLDAGDAPARPEDHERQDQQRELLDALSTFHVEVDDLHTIVGPTVTRYELGLAPGVKISSIRSLRDDLAMAIAAPSLRMIAPIPGKSAIGVEVPNRHRELVRVRDLIASHAFSTTQYALPLVLGKTIEGEVYVDDLTTMPHLLIAGATGAGKSVGLNSLIVGLLYACPPESLKFVFIDPKKIELQVYARLAKHYLAADPDLIDTPVITDVAPALQVLQRCEREMEERYDRLARAGVRSIAEYNARCRWGGLLERDGHRPMPFLVVVIDELADLMLSSGKVVEAPIARLAQMARAVGIHLVVATQRPSVDVVTGLIKANFPARIAYQVATKVDSRTILDQNGAEELVGRGDLLYMKGSRLIRLQGPYVDLDEIERVTNAIAEQPATGPYLLPADRDEALLTA
ncbi:MAG: DNA translocase FtsK 4TM domain-containing protein [Rhodothermales bacterium]